MGAPADDDATPAADVQLIAVASATAAPPTPAPAFADSLDVPATRRARRLRALLEPTVVVVGPSAAFPRSEPIRPAAAAPGLVHSGRPPGWQCALCGAAASATAAAERVPAGRRAVARRRRRRPAWRAGRAGLAGHERRDGADGRPVRQARVRRGPGVPRQELHAPAPARAPQALVQRLERLRPSQTSHRSLAVEAPPVEPRAQAERDERRR